MWGKNPPQSCLQRPTLFWVACFGNVLTALSSSDMESLWDLSHIDKRSAPPMPYKLELKALSSCVVVVHSCLELKLIRHGWGASLVDVEQVSKTCPCHLRTKPRGRCQSMPPKKGSDVANMIEVDSSPTIIIIIIIFGRNRSFNLVWGSGGDRQKIFPRPQAK